MFNSTKKYTKMNLVLDIIHALLFFRIIFATICVITLTNIFGWKENRMPSSYNKDNVWGRCPVGPVVSWSGTI